MSKFVIVKRRKNNIKKEELFSFERVNLINLVKKYNNNSSFRLTKEISKEIINDKDFKLLKESDVKEERDFYDALKLMSKIAKMYEIWFSERD